MIEFESIFEFRAIKERTSKKGNEYKLVYFMGDIESFSCMIEGKYPKEVQKGDNVLAKFELNLQYNNIKCLGFEIV